MLKEISLLWLLKLSCPLTIVAYITIGLYGYFQPWQPAEETLTSYEEQTSVMVGASYRTQNNIKITSRSYVLFPSLFRGAKIITVQQANQENPVVLESKFQFFFFIGTLLVGIVGTWWFWFRKASKAPPNQAFKRDS